MAKTGEVDRYASWIGEQYPAHQATVEVMQAAP
jgi:hypothetical protein